MDINVILQAVSTVGFPIVCCGALFWKMNKDNERHKQEMETLRTAIENNTAALIELKVKYDEQFQFRKIFIQRQPH